MIIKRNSSAHRSRAYTLVELSIVALLSAVLIAAAARWVGQLGQVALQQVATGVQANVIIATDRLDDDITAATHCNPWQLDSPVVEVTQSSLTMYVDSDGDGNVKLVRWSVDTNTGLLTRAEAEPGANCSAATLPQGVIMLTGVATGTSQSPVFTPAFDGILTENATDWGECVDRSSERCRFDAIAVNLTVLDTGEPVVATNIFNLSV